MKCLVTGAAGFIGSNLTDRLLALDHEVVGYDNLSTGQQRFLEPALKNPGFRLVQADMLDLDALKNAMAGGDFVFHFAANADVRFGTQHPRRDLEQNTIATWNVLEAMRLNNVQRIAFSSTGSIYGEPDVFPTPESCPFPVQTSLYGASKLAAEGLIAAYSAGFGMQAFIFRFVSILGERYSHGHVFDFYKQLSADSETLSVLGDGTQRKSYLHIADCVSAILAVIEKPQGAVNIYNLGTDEFCQLSDSIRWICEHLGMNPKIIYSGGKRGWIGDSPFIFLDCARIRDLGWRPESTIKQGVISTLKYLQENTWLFDAR